MLLEDSGGSVSEKPRTSQPEPPSARTVPEKRAAAIAVPLAAVAVIVAILVNWLYAPPLSNLGVTASKKYATAYEPGIPDLAKKPIQMLPSEILAYEVITRQGIPGRQDRAAEAIYTTLNMDLELQRPTNVYARAEAFPSRPDAVSAQTGIMKDYTVKSETMLVGGVTVAKAGFNKEMSAFVVTWIRGQYVTFVKASFREIPPVWKREVLRTIAMPVLTAIDRYQRTGKEGLDVGAQAPATTTMPTPAPSSPKK